MKQASVTVQARKVSIRCQRPGRGATGDRPAAAIELSDGTIVTGKTSELLGASAALILNALKVLAGLDADMHLISPACTGSHPHPEGQISGRTQPAAAHG